MNYADLRKRDIRHIWHPYTEITSFERSDFPIFDRGAGCTLRTVDGQELLDGIASWWCVNLGHSHPRIVEAIQKQAGELQHAMLGNASHPRAIELAERMAQLAPGGLGHSMFAADGSCAVEAAIKIALQYWDNIGVSGKTRLISLEGDYHGDSLGAVSAGYVETFHKPFRSVLLPVLRAKSPGSADAMDSMAELLERHHAECAAVIVEPLCQAAAGIRIYPEAYLKRLRALCDQYDVLLICDEIAVGFWRTGAMFASERAGITPDIMTVGKGLTGGMLPMSATLVTDRIYDSFRHDGTRARTFYHGHTFCGNPITAAAALAALDVYRDEGIVEGLPPKIELLKQRMEAIGRALGDSSVRSLGMIAAIEIGESAGGAKRATEIVRRAQERGLFIRPLGSIVYLWPPLIADIQTLNRMLDILCEAATHPADARA